MFLIQITNVSKESLSDLKQEKFDKNLMSFREIPKVRRHDLIAFETNLIDLAIFITDTGKDICVNLLASWIFNQYLERNVTTFTKINNRNLLEDELKDKKLLTQILEHELKKIQLEKQIKKEQEND